jgi:hypothetical protein
VAESDTPTSNGFSSVFFSSKHLMNHLNQVFIEKSLNHQEKKKKNNKTTFSISGIEPEISQKKSRFKIPPILA